MSNDDNNAQTPEQEGSLSITYPTPLLQPDPHEGCMIYSVAYLCHCLGYISVTPEQIKQYRIETRYTEPSFPKMRLAIRSDFYWEHRQTDYQRFWLGKEQRKWVEEHLADRWIALACIHRIPEMGHIVVLLEANETDVLLADPITGLVWETWDWFLGAGPTATHGSHCIHGWYSKPQQEQQ